MESEIEADALQGLYGSCIKTANRFKTEIERQLATAASNQVLQYGNCSKQNEPSPHVPEKSKNPTCKGTSKRS